MELEMQMHPLTTFLPNSYFYEYKNWYTAIFVMIFFKVEASNYPIPRYVLKTGIYDFAK